MALKNELDLQVDDLKSKIAVLFEKFNTLQNSMNTILNLTTSNPQYIKTQDTLGQVKLLANDLNEIMKSDDFYQLKYFMCYLEKLIFDLEYQLECIPEEETEPEILNAMLIDDGVSLKGILSQIKDPDIKLTNISYQLYKDCSGIVSEIEYNSSSISMFEKYFDYRDEGTYYFIATYYYESKNNIIKNKCIQSNVVEVQIKEKIKPTICCAALVEYNGILKGILTNIQDVDCTITKLVYTLKDSNGHSMEIIEKNSPKDGISFSGVYFGKYFYTCDCYYNLGKSQDVIHLTSNFIENNVI